MIEKQVAKRSVFGKVAVVLLVAGLLVWLTLFEGWVLHKLWGWFVVHAGLAQPVGVTDMIGVSILVKVLCGVGATRERKAVDVATASAALAVMALLMGWVITLVR